MKLAVISDIHGNLRALEIVLADLATIKADTVWILGDLAAHGAYPAECVTKIREMREADKANVKVIGGNTDRYLVTNARPKRSPAKDEEAYQEYMKGFQLEDAILNWGVTQLGWENYEFLSKILGKEAHLKIDDYGIVMGYHAIPGDDEYNITDDTPDEEAMDSVLDRPLRMGVYGHIHRQVNRDLGRVHLVNPGSVGMSFETPGKAQYMILTFENGDVDMDMRQIPYDVDAAVQDLHDTAHPQPAFIEKIYREGKI